MSCKSFDEFPRNELVVARDNLAEVFMFKLAQQAELAHLWHIAGNLVLATAATIDSGLSGREIESGLVPVLHDAGGKTEDAAHLAEQMTENDALRMIFPLGHIPDTAPELILGQRSRELDVSRFAREARKFRPSRIPDPTIRGTGNQMFIGMYIRKLG